MLSGAGSRCWMPSIVRRGRPRSIARYSREPGVEIGDRMSRLKAEESGKSGRVILVGRIGGGGVRPPRWQLIQLFEPGGANPAGLRDVDRHSVGAAVLHLDVGIPMAGVADAEGLVDVLTGRRTGGLQPLGDRFQAFHLKADVMDAAPVLAALDASHRVVLEVEDRQIEVAVAQVVTPGARTVDLRDLLHAEHLDVELGRLVHVLGREGDVLDLRHGVSPVTVVRGRLVCQSRQVTPEAAETPGQSRAALQGDRKSGCSDSSRNRLMSARGVTSVWPGTGTSMYHAGVGPWAVQRAVPKPSTRPVRRPGRASETPPPP